MQVYQSMEYIKLSELGEGKKGIIKGFDNEDYSLKLMEMGCVPGEVVLVKKNNFSEDPINLFVSGYNLSLRKKEAEYIIVELIIQ